MPSFCIELLFLRIKVRLTIGLVGVRAHNNSVSSIAACNGNSITTFFISKKGWKLPVKAFWY